MISMASGTSGSHQRVKPNDILNIKMPLPPEELIKEFNGVVLSSFKEIQNRIGENQNLKVLRDTLLPKLMSGELTVNQAEKMTA